MLSTDPQSQQQLRAAAAALRQLPRQLQAELDTASTKFAAPLVIRAASQRASSPLQQALARSARVSNDQAGVSLAFGGSAAVATGARGSDVAWGAEQGARGTRRSTYSRRSPAGKQHSVTRRTTRQFGPYSTAGKFVGPAVESSTGDIAERWADDLIKLTVTALDRGH
jgi:hypothetical protein